MVSRSVSALGGMRRLKSVVSVMRTLDTKIVVLDREDDIASYVSMQLLKGTAFLHEHDVVHRDLKLPNVLVTNSAEATEQGNAPSLLCSALLAWNICHASQNTVFCADAVACLGRSLVPGWSLSVYAPIFSLLCDAQL